MTDHTHCLNLKTTVCRPACLHFICIKLLNNLTLTTFSSLREGPENTSSATLAAKTCFQFSKSKQAYPHIIKTTFIPDEQNYTDLFSEKCNKIMVKNTKNNNIVLYVIFPLTIRLHFFYLTTRNFHISLNCDV